MKFIDWLKHLFLHDWLYCSPAPINGEWCRGCKDCDEKQHQKNGKWHKGWL